MEKIIDSRKPSVEKRWVDGYDIVVTKEVPHSNLYDYILDCNKDNMNGIAFTFMGKKITFEEFFTNVERVEKAFRIKGVEAGDVVPLVLATIPEAAYLFYALNKIGAVSCMIDPRLNPYNISRDINLTNSDLLISITNACKSIKSSTDLKDLQEIVMLSAVNSVDSKLLKGLMKISDFTKGNHPLASYENWNSFVNSGNDFSGQLNSYYTEGNPAAIVFTGGTTGVHKGVVLSNDAINNTVFEHNYLIDDVEKGENFLDILPPFIAYGLTSMHLSISFGLNTIMDPVAAPQTFAKQIVENKPSIVFGGPIHWEALLRSKEMDKATLEYLKYAVSGGEKLSVTTAKKINDFLVSKGCKNGILDGYGASECCGVFSLKKGSHNTDGTVGYPLYFNDMCILNEETFEEEDYNVEGEICISGPSLMNSYYKNETETERVFITDAYGRKWIRTGDLGKINEKGELIITGRKKRIFVCGINKVYPPEMEEIIMSIQGVRKCAVTGVDDPVLRTVPKVHLLLEDDYIGKEEEIKEQIHNLISERISELVVPKYYSFENDFVYTGSGKVDFIAMTKNDNAELEQKKLKKSC